MGVRNIKRVMCVALACFMITGCGNSHTENDYETEINNFPAENNEEDIEDIPDEASELFQPDMPVHQGIWECRSYDNIICWYEFDKDMQGQRLDYNEADSRKFTYEVIDDNRIELHYDDKDEYARFDFDEDGMHLILTYKDYQHSLSWISHGTIEDIGGLGISLSTENVTSEGCELIITQEGGYPTGDIVIDSGFGMMAYVDESECWEWKEDIEGDGRELNIEKDSTVRKEINWHDIYGNLAPDRYFLCFSIRDIRSRGGSWDSYVYRVEVIVP